MFMSKHHQHTAHHPQAKAAHGNSGERDSRFMVRKLKGHDQVYASEFPDHSRTGMKPHLHGIGWEDAVYV
jgi:hypothetical protein